MQFLFVSTEEVANSKATLEERYESANKLPVIRKFHYLEVTDNNRILAKTYSSSQSYHLYSVIKDAGNIAEGAEDELDFEVGDFYGVLLCKTYQVGKVLSYNKRAEELTFSLIGKVEKEELH